MVDVTKIKVRIDKILRLYPQRSEVTPIESIEFTYKISPFNSDLFVVFVDYNKKLDIIRIIGRVSLTNKIKSEYNTKSNSEKLEIVSLFSKIIRDRSFSSLIQKDDLSSISFIKILFNQNLSAQNLLDTVEECIFILEDLLDLLVEVDKTLDVPKVNNTDNMFQ